MKIHYRSIRSLTSHIRLDIEGQEAKLTVKLDYLNTPNPEIQFLLYHGCGPHEVAAEFSVPTPVKHFLSARQARQYPSPEILNKNDKHLENRYSMAMGAIFAFIIAAGASSSHHLLSSSPGNLQTFVALAEIIHACQIRGLFEAACYFHLEKKGVTSYLCTEKPRCLIMDDTEHNTVSINF